MAVEGVASGVFGVLGLIGKLQKSDLKLFKLFFSGNITSIFILKRGEFRETFHKVNNNRGLLKILLTELVFLEKDSLAHYLPATTSVQNTHFPFLFFFLLLDLQKMRFFQTKSGFLHLRIGEKV